METIEQRVIEVLRYSGLTIKELARRSDIGYSTLYSSTIGRRPVNLEIVQGLLRAYPEIEEGWLILGRGEMLSGKVQAALKRKK